MPYADWIVAIMTMTYLQLLTWKKWYGWPLGMITQGFWIYLSISKELYGLTALSAVMTIQFTYGWWNWTHNTEVDTVIRYQVFDNGRPAQYPYCKVHESWNCSIYDSFEDALQYARKWLGNFGGSADGKEGIVLVVNQPWDYNGCGDMIEIREMRNETVRQP